MRTSLYIKTQAEILADIEARMTDTGNTLATDAQYYAAINEGIRMWGPRVTVPMVYEFTDGFTSGTYEYTLPDYIHPPFRVQVKSSTYSYLGVQVVDDDNNFTWEDVVGFSVEPTPTGGYKLRLPISPVSEDARLIWYAQNGPLPTASVTMNTANISSTTTTFSVNIGASWPDVLPYGVIKIDEEIMVYQDLERTSASLFTFGNLIRGIYGTVAATHASDPVYWCVAVDDLRLWVQLYDYVAGYVHALQLHKSTTEDMGRHEKLMSFYFQRASEFWRVNGYVGQRRGNLVLSRNAMGPYTW